jgi:hypothetical protein
VLEQHSRTVYSVTWGTGKPDKVEDDRESLGWVASTGGDGKINVWAFEVSHQDTASGGGGAGFDQHDLRNHWILPKGVLQSTRSYHASKMRTASMT